jgi:flagellar hook-associated protein 2
MASLSSAGIGSNLDVNGIVSKLMTVEAQPLTTLAQKEASYQTQLTAYGTLSGAVSSFQSAMSGLSSTAGFLATKATPSDTTVLTASAANTAVPGNYSIDVTALAYQQKLVAAGKASASAAIAAGAATLNFDFGTITGTLNGTGQYISPGTTFTSAGAGTKSVSIAAGASLSDIRDAINAAAIGVTATIVNDGSATVPNRLVLTSNNSGAANSMKITVTGDATVAGLLANDPAGGVLAQNLSETITAKNAAFKLDGMVVTKPSNTVTDAIPGVTLNLAKMTSGTPITLAVARDPTAVQTSAQSFVSAYNALHASLASLTYYNASNQTSGALQGDVTARTIDTDVRRTLTSALAGAGGYQNLSQLGIAMQKDGTLALDSTKLQTAVTNNSIDIPAVFAQTGRATDPAVAYGSATSATMAGSYAVNVTALATQGKTAGSGAPTTLVIDATNNTLAVSLDGVGATVTLTNATYASAAALALEVQTQINSAAAIVTAGSAVTASVAGGAIVITSNRYGSTSSVSVTGGNGLANLLEPAGAQTPTTGTNVAGTIGGLPATGSGQTLTGASGAVAGLQLVVSGGTTGTRGTVNYSNGYAYQFSQLSSRFTGTTGTIAGRTTGINASITDIGKQRDEWNIKLTAIEARYRAEFTALDMLMGSMTTTSNFLTQQLANLPKS